MCKKYERVFIKLLIANKRTALDPVTLPVIPCKLPSRQANKCLPTQPHWKRVINQMIDALLDS